MVEELISDITKQQGTPLPGLHRPNLSFLLKKIESGFRRERWWFNLYQQWATMKC